MDEPNGNPPNEPRRRSKGKTFSPPRPLTRREREVLKFLVSQSFRGHEELISQVPATRVAAQEPDGATISLVVDRSIGSPARVNFRIPVQAVGETRDGEPCEILLFVDDGYLSAMEIILHSIPASKEALEFPPPANLKIDYLV